MYDETEDYAVHELEALAARLKSAIRYSIAQSLVEYFPPSEEPPPELRALMGRLDEM
jgi:hypothetical protein